MGHIPLNRATDQSSHLNLYVNKSHLARYVVKRQIHHLFSLLSDQLGPDQILPLHFCRRFLFYVIE
jgi:hypothetical protein